MRLQGDRQLSTAICIRTHGGPNAQPQNVLFPCIMQSNFKKTNCQEHWWLWIFNQIRAFDMGTMVCWLCKCSMNFNEFSFWILAWANPVPRFSKDTEYYWIPPSLATGEWSPTDPIRYANDVEEARPWAFPWDEAPGKGVFFEENGWWSLITHW